MSTEYLLIMMNLQDGNLTHVLCANAFAEDIINSHISGMNWYLTKPIDADKLMTALKECIRKNNIR